MRLIKPLLLIVLVCCYFLANAQDDKLSYDLTYGRTPASKGGSSFVGNSIKLLFPIKESGFSIGPGFSIVNINQTGSLLDSITPKTIGLAFGYRTRIGQKTMLMLHVEPLLSSDFIDISGEDIRFKSEAMVLIPTSSKFAFGFGLGYQYQFSGSQILPIVTMVWHISDGITLSGPLPLVPRLDFKIAQKWTLGAGIKGDYGSYRLSATKYDSRYAQYSNFNFGINTQYKPDSHWVLSGFLGFGKRKIDIYKKDQKVPLRIYGWDIGGGSYTPYFSQKYSGLSLTFGLAYKI